MQQTFETHAGLVRSARHAFAIIVAVVAFCANGTAASATPYIDVTADWTVSAASFAPLPTGIVVSCFGGASSAGTGCSDGRTLDTTVTTSQQLSLSAASGITLTNTTNQTFTSDAIFQTDFSAFNPGGPQVGISIDDPSTQGASYSSSVSGPSVYDAHSCSVGVLGYSGGPSGSFSTTACGVASPDSSELLLFVDLATLAPGESEQIPYAINIDATFSVDEPSSVWIFGISLLAFGALVRRLLRPAG